MNSKLCPFFHQLPKGELDGEQAVANWISTYKPAIVKTMIPFSRILSLSNHRPHRVIGRKWLANQDLDDPVRMARDIADSSLGRECQAGVIDAMELHNEPQPHGGGWQHLLDFEPHLVDEMLARNIPPIILNWSVGQPDEVVGQSPDKRMVFWDDSRAHVLMTKSGIYAYGEHDYCAPLMWQKESFDPEYVDKEEYVTGGWYFGRYRRAYCQLRETLGEGVFLPDVFLGEIGNDGGINTGGKWVVPAVGGWKNFCTFVDYLEQLTWADRQMQQDCGQIVNGKRRPNVIGGSPFILATSDFLHWASFEYWAYRVLFGEYILAQAQNIPVEEWLSQWVYTSGAHIPFVPDNWIMKQVLAFGYIPVSDEKTLNIPGVGLICVQVAESQVVNRWYKKVFYWLPGDWNHYRVLTLPN